MDIAKIRKKAREKEEQKAAEGHKEPSEERVSDPSDAPVEEADDAVELKGGYPEEEESGSLPEATGAGAVTLPAEETMEEPHEHGETSPPDDGDVLELLAFGIAGKEFAFRIADVEEIIPFQGITAVPLLPDYVSGIMSLRGKIIPVVDLKSRFGLVKSARATSTSGTETDGRKEKIIILSGPKGLIGAIADRIKGVLRFHENNVLAPPAHLSDEERRFLEGVVIMEKRFISIVRFGDTMNIEVG